MLIHFIHRIDNSNIGDLASCPLEYFKYFRQFKIKKHDIYQIDFKSIRKNDIVIIGGGGLFNCLEEWNISINKVLKICNNVIGWGIGFNTHHGTKTKTSINFSKFKLLSIRDYNHPSGLNFVPCPSCMQSFPSRRIKRDIGILKHKDFQMNLSYPCVENNVKLSDFLKFIASSNYIITNTYHGWYWATLYGKKVILKDTFSTKFEYLPFKTISFSQDIEKDKKNAYCHKNSLRICRKKNKIFFQQVKTTIEEIAHKRYKKRIISVFNDILSKIFQK